ncbi:DNA sulfur modification protein DndD [Roseivirga ehrenbergii]|uniref:DNA sulfur modification protein DndD n=1 Tax=Roseivirga ehrenbergii (strain DSM 102268 / JCM 13514 / KCTC 12282 / NCIMB 14502 / KMM 6017) TaxID=279360 RepID=A0A150XSC6_ROSEK|nr:DNA sulfur modification protein DndD [Roseivirga ehrenbergii]KYG81659.1 DNA sulfur modification protein DndD [Roseivirga ehrenbergii]TCL10834.1 DNA sulfur modification protein DndD [Roseivirga ehrenbergii]
MIFTEVEFNNFRIYKGNNPIYLAPSADKNITVVSGMNGFGKTTFLMGLVWCLYGRQMDQVDDFYKKEIKSYGGYDKYIGNSLNRLALKEGRTVFSVSIVITDLNIPEIPCQEIKITRAYDVVTSASDKVQILIDGHESELVKGLGDTKLTAEEIFIRDFIMPMEIAKFFFFDAEKIITLAEVADKQQRVSLNRAYSEVLGIKKYEDLKAELEEVLLRIRQDSASANERMELEKLQAEYNQINIEVEVKTEQIDNNTSDIEKLEFEATQIQEKLIREGNQMTAQQLEELRGKAATLESKLKILQDELKSSYDVIPFAIAGDKLLSVLNQLDIESELKNAQLSEEQVKDSTDKIINDLIAQPKPKDVVIDYRVEDFYKTTIKSLIRKHFFSGVPTVDPEFQFIHDYSDTEKNELGALVNSLKLSFKESFRRINGDYNYSKNELSTIRRQLKLAESNAEDPVISALRTKKKKIDNDIESLTAKVNSLHQEIGAANNNKGQLKRRIDNISQKIEVSKSLKAKDETTKRLIGELQTFIEEFKKQKKESLEREILSGLNSLMHKKSFIKKVDVDIIGDEIDIQLRNERNEVIRKEGLSNGEKQMYASALLKGLVEESNIEFPVFIDSPMQKFDVKHAENIVRYFYPSISDQVVIFPLVKKEMTQDEYDIILPRVSNVYLIHNLGNDHSEFKEVKNPEDLFQAFEEISADAV